MRLKLYRAASMPEAMRRIRAELGTDAIILATRRVADEVEVTAALEPEEDAAEPLLIPPPPAPAGPVPPGGAGVPGAAGRAAAAPPPGLAAHNLPAGLAAGLAGGALEERLAAMLEFAPLPAGAPRPLLLVGPPGAGKTLTCAKLAARRVLGGEAAAAAGPPLVVTTDDRRTGATEQLAAFTRLLGLTLAVAPGPAALAKALRHRGGSGTPALIDTAGCDPFAPAEAAALRDLARAAEAEIALVLPAGLDAEEAAELARGFAALGARHLIPTRLDLTRRLGGVLAAAAAAPLALGEAGSGPGVADGLTPLTPALLAARLLAPLPLRTPLEPAA
ncbi:flagellar biosynthesis protein FlhF [Caldovatus aquaticus]|uniref:GTPase n=1 Tax=Caldovatus aquaticus TaxID=2865671 RepID=A0ABS7F5V9_9PROT|nr:GTPase [Caldovatus aquaticus]MBW8270703.1 GTPase [Caldovatus aquaticus]